MTGPQRVRLEVGHSPHCMFRGDDEPNDFWVPGVDLKRDALGRRNGQNWTWRTYLCNDPDCPGTAIVRADLIRDLIAEALRV